jgi:hypothetical protein
VSLAMICHSARKDDDTVGIEFTQKPMVDETAIDDKDKKVFVYPLSSL